MKIHVGGTTKNVDIKDTAAFVAATKNTTLFATRIAPVETSAQHNELIKKLNQTPRPYAVAVLTVTPQ